jgi:hypothetical protein
MNAAAPIDFQCRRRDHVTHLLREMHWLQTLKRIAFPPATLIMRVSKMRLSATCPLNYKVTDSRSVSPSVGVVNYIDGASQPSINHW